MDEKDATIADIREWLVKIDTNQSHQTQLLERLNHQADNAFSKASAAEYKAEKALAIAEGVDKDFRDYVNNERTGRRWLIGVLVTVGIALVPLLTSFYFNAH